MEGVSKLFFMCYDLCPVIRMTPFCTTLPRLTLESHICISGLTSVTLFLLECAIHYYVPLRMHHYQPTDVLIELFGVCARGVAATHQHTQNCELLSSVIYMWHNSLICATRLAHILSPTSLTHIRCINASCHTHERIMPYP